MKRNTIKTPGYHCAPGHPHGDCPGVSGNRNHGIRGEKWSYALNADDDLTALVLTIYTDIFPPAVPQYCCIECGHFHSFPPCPVASCGCQHSSRYGSDLTFHVGFPFRDTDGSIREPGGSGCCFLGGASCESRDTSALKAREFFAAYGDPRQAEQTGSFWVPFEEEFGRRDRRVRANRSALPTALCPSCRGTGNVNGLFEFGEILGVAATAEIASREAHAEVKRLMYGAQSFDVPAIVASAPEGFPEAPKTGDRLTLRTTIEEDRVTQLLVAPERTREAVEQLNRMARSAEAVDLLDRLQGVNREEVMPRGFTRLYPRPEKKLVRRKLTDWRRR